MKGKTSWKYAKWIKSADSITQGEIKMGFELFIIN